MHKYFLLYFLAKQTLVIVRAVLLPLFPFSTSMHTHTHSICVLTLRSKKLNRKNIILLLNKIMIIINYLLLRIELKSNNDKLIKK